MHCGSLHWFLGNPSTTSSGGRSIFRATAWKSYSRKLGNTTAGSILKRRSESLFPPFSTPGIFHFDVSGILETSKFRQGGGRQSCQSLGAALSSFRCVQNARLKECRTGRQKGIETQMTFISIF